MAIICNLISCIILGLVLRLLKSITMLEETEAGGQKIETAVNKIVTGSHILLIVTYTLISIPHFNIAATNHLSAKLPAYRWLDAWTLVGCVSDLFILCMIWQVFTGESNKKIYLRHEGKTYPIKSIVDVKDPYEEEEIPDRESVYSRSSMDNGE